MINSFHYKTNSMDADITDEDTDEDIDEDESSFWQTNPPQSLELPPLFQQVDGYSLLRPGACNATGLDAITNAQATNVTDDDEALIDKVALVYERASHENTTFGTKSNLHTLCSPMSHASIQGQPPPPSTTQSAGFIIPNQNRSTPILHKLLENCQNPSIDNKDQDDYINSYGQDMNVIRSEKLPNNQSTEIITQDVEVEFLPKEAMNNSKIEYDEQYCAASAIDLNGVNFTPPIESVWMNESVPEFSYTTTPTWQSMVKLTPSINNTTSSRIFTSPSESNSSISQSNNNTTDDINSLLWNPQTDGVQTSLDICTSTPLLLTDTVNKQCKMGQDSTQLTKKCIQKDISPFVSPFLASMAMMPSPLEFSGAVKAAPVVRSTLNTPAPQERSPRLSLTPQKTTPKRTISLVRTSACHPIAKLAFAAKPELRFDNFMSPPQVCNTVQWKQPAMHQSPRLLVNKKNDLNKLMAATPTKRKRITCPAATQITSAPKEQYQSADYYGQEKCEAVEALLNVHF